MVIYIIVDGLLNDFINGILLEGDFCFWVSMDNGLSWMAVFNGFCINYYVEDGLIVNEFNWIFFYCFWVGWFYFGGLNGINVFFFGL